MKKPTKKQVADAEAAYWSERQRYGENNMATRRAWSKWRELKEKGEK